MQQVAGSCCGQACIRGKRMIAGACMCWCFLKGRLHLARVRVRLATDGACAATCLLNTPVEMVASELVRACCHGCCHHLVARCGMRCLLLEGMRRIVLEARLKRAISTDDLCYHIWNMHATATVCAGRGGAMQASLPVARLRCRCGFGS